jgi:general L-amino acid transport system permease protein
VSTALTRRSLPSPLDAALSIACLAVLAWVGVRAFGWGVLDAGFGTTPESCAGRSGACWSVIGDFWRVFLVGLYPQESRWRAFLALTVLIVLAGLGVVPAAYRHRAYPVAVALAIPALLLLLRCGVFGLQLVPTRYWGGLLISIGLAVTGLAAGLPFGILLALGRASRTLPVVRGSCTLVIELTRSVPFIFVLVMGSIALPMFLPVGWNIDPMVRVACAIALSASVNAAEIVRSGIASVDPGQSEAARSLGLRYWHVTGLIILPQALRVMLPVFVGMFIIYFKDTSLVVAVGLVDLLVATGNPKWVGRTIETYVFVGAIYFAFCTAISHVGRRLEAGTPQRQ